MDERLTEFARQTQKRNASESALAGLIFVLFVFELITGPDTLLAGLGYLIGAVAAVIVVAVLWGLLAVNPAEVTRQPPAEFAQEWQSRLTRQARILRMAWLWYVLPLDAGVVLIILGHTGVDMFLRTGLAIIAVLGGIWVARVHIRTAESVERLRDNLAQSASRE